MCFWKTDIQFRHKLWSNNKESVHLNGIFTDMYKICECVEDVTFNAHNLTGVERLDLLFGRRIKKHAIFSKAIKMACLFYSLANALDEPFYAS